MNEPRTQGDPEEALFLYLASQTKADRDTLRSIVGPMSEQDFGLTLHRVRERLRSERSIEFIPVVSQPGTLVRANDSQKVNRSEQFTRTALRKQQRALRVLRAVNPEGLDPSQQGRFRTVYEKTANAAIRTEQVGNLRAQPVTVCEVASIPRRGK